MADPFSLGALGALTAMEGIKFLYSQAAEVLKRWRDRKAGTNQLTNDPVPVTSPEVIEGELTPLEVDFDVVDRVHEDIEQLASVLGNYASGLQVPSAANKNLVEAADGLRRVLEIVYRQRITFKGENREPSGPVVMGHADVDKVIGDVAGVRARLIRSGRIEGTVKANEVTGKAAGVSADTIGND